MTAKHSLWNPDQNTKKLFSIIPEKFIRLFIALLGG